MRTRGWVIGVAAVLVLTGCASKERMIPVGSTVVADTTGGKGPDVYSYCDEKGNLLYMTKDKSGPVAVIQGGCKPKLPDAPVAAAAPVIPPLGRHFLDQPVAQCVIASPVSPTAVMLTPCPVGTAGPPPAVAEPKAPEPVVIRIEVVPVPPDTPTPKAAPKAAPKKVCPCP
jgi:hypothetical protein